MAGAFLMSAILGLATLTAQERSAAPPESEIIVEGRRPTERQIESFVDALATEPGRLQLARFELPVCPLALGLQPSQNRLIVERMRRVAAAAGIPAAPTICEPNVLVVVTRDKGEVVEQLRREQPDYFIDVSLAEARRLARGSGTVAAWQVEGLRTFQGVDAQRDIERGAYTTSTDPQRGASRIGVSSHPHFLFAAVVIEMGAIAGLSTTQLADYAAMRSFARVDPRRLEGSSIPTILTALDAPVGSAVPVTLTEWDLSYLRALYSTEINQLAAQQRSDMRRRLGEYLQNVR